MTFPHEHLSPLDTPDQAIFIQLMPVSQPKSSQQNEPRLQSEFEDSPEENVGHDEARDLLDLLQDAEAGINATHVGGAEPTTIHAAPSSQSVESKAYEAGQQSSGADFPALTPSRITTETGKQIQQMRLMEGSAQSQHGRTLSTQGCSTHPPEAVETHISRNVHNDLRHEDNAVLVPFNPPSHQLGSPWSSAPYGGLIEDVFPRTVECVLSVTFDEEPVLGSLLIVPDLVWYDKQSYETLETKIDEIVRHSHTGVKNSQKYEIYLRYASCFVRGARNQPTRRLDNEDVLIDSTNAFSDHATQAVRRFIRHYPYEPFKLVIHCDYSDFEKCFTEKDESQPWPLRRSFSLALRDQYFKKTKTGRTMTDTQRYVSLADQRVLITPGISRRIIDADTESTPELTIAEKQELKREAVGRTAMVLQAVCVYDCIPMRFLYHVLCEDPHRDRGYSDNRETLPLNTPNMCRHELCEIYFERFVENTYHFFPEVIKSSAEHSKKDDKAIVPIRRLDESRDLGEGGFSIVYEVGIDPHYQLISPDITKTYALKVFKTGQRYKESFERELEMLLRLATYLSHEHILTHITSWEHKQRHYILYEKAESNLREHMTQLPAIDLSSDHVLWFFYQLRGLSDAVRCIHFTDEPHVGQSRGEARTERIGVAGRHHDIKPENILAFGSPRNLPTLKLTDFGSGKFSVVQAFDESPAGASRNRATETYCGPEKAMQKKEMKRPYDMWALGCVYLEMLLWFIGLSKPDGKNEFSDMRTDPQYVLQTSNENMMVDWFWQRDALGSLKLNGAVVFVLEKLQEEECKDMQPFQDLIQLIRQLLVIEPEKRLKATALFSGLDAIFDRARVELENWSTRYTDIYHKNKISDHA